jgi:hypothetical protein
MGQTGPKWTVRATSAFALKATELQFAHFEQTFPDVGRALPVAFRKQGAEIRIAVMPLERPCERSVDRHE